MESGKKSKAQRFLRDVQDQAFFKERKRIELANAEKTARLKALRLAKAANDAETREQESNTTPDDPANGNACTGDDNGIVSAETGTDGTGTTMHARSERKDGK